MSEDSQVAILGIVSLALAVGSALFILAPKIVAVAVLAGLLAITGLVLWRQRQRIEHLQEAARSIRGMPCDESDTDESTNGKPSVFSESLRNDESQVLEMIAADSDTDSVLEGIVAMLAREYAGSSFRIINDELFSEEMVDHTYTVLPRTDTDTGWVLQANFHSGDDEPDQAVLDLACDLARLALDKHRSRTNLKYQAEHDALTGLLSRRAVLAALDDGIATGESVALVYCDIDEFKEINDTLGHQTGDDLLTGIADRLSEAAAEAPFKCEVGRLGGDEYLIVASGGTKRDVVSFVERLSFAIRVPFAIGGTSLSTSLSLGVTYAPAPGPDDSQSKSDELLKESDLALYQVKRSGRDGYRMFDDELREILDEQRRLYEDLKRSITSKTGIHAMFQPQFNQHRELIGFEALGRWYRPSLGLVNPDDFLGVAADHGLLAAFDLTVFSHVAQTLSTLRREGRQFGTVAINVSAERLEAPDFVKSTLNVLRRASIDPRDIVLEITESSLLQDLHDRGQRLEELRQWGVRIAIDDFGTGYSSLSYLRKLPVDIVKLDKEFVSDIDTSEESEAIVTAILALARALDLDVVAEGVERESQYTLLSDLGCTVFQGFLLGKPKELQDARDMASQRWAPDVFCSAYEWADGPPKDASEIAGKSAVELEPGSAR